MEDELTAAPDETIASAPLADRAQSGRPQWDEKARLAALRRYRVLDTPSEEPFEEIVKVAALVCKTPLALISLVDEKRQWFKSEQGLGTRETAIENSVCATAIRHDGIFIVPDLSADPRFAAAGIVRDEPRARFYAGAPITTPAGLPLGMVCVLDTKPRPEGLTDEQAAVLTSLARQTMLQLELRERDKELEQRRSNLFRLVSKAPIGIVQTSVDGTIVFVNDEYAALTGRTIEELIGRSLKDFVHDDDALLHAEAIGRVLGGEANVAIEERYIGPDGTERWASDHISLTSGPDGMPQAIFFVGREITERLRAAAALAASERKFRVITDAMPQMVWATLPDGSPDYFNERWHAFTGTPEGATQGDRWSEVLHPDDQVRARERWAQSVGTGEDYEIEYRLRHNTGDYRWVLARAQPLHNSSGEIERWFGTCTDIEDIKQAEEARMLLAGELSHRIKNIFTVVGGLVSLTARGDDRAQDFARHFRERLGALAAAHEYVRPDSLAAGMLDTGQTVKGLLGILLQPYTANAGSRFEVSGPDAPIGPKTAAAFALVMHEQATNAVKYGSLSKASGRVEIRTEQVGDAFVLTWCEIGGPGLEGPPERRGFGTDLAARSAAGQLGGRIEHLWESEGLVVRLSVPWLNLTR